MKTTITDVLRSHLPVKLQDGRVLCLHDPEAPGDITFDGPVFYREHVAEVLIDALMTAGWTPPGTDRQDLVPPPGMGDA